MSASIAQALLYGYTPRVILNQIARAHPKYANAIHTAQAAGYGADTVLSMIDQKKGSKANDPEDYLTDHERVQKRDTQQKNKAALQVLGVLGTAGAIGIGAYAYANRNNAVHPTQILPAQRGQPGQNQLPNQTINQQPQQLPNRQLQLPYNQKGNGNYPRTQGLLPFNPRGQGPQQQPNQVPIEQPPQQSNDVEELQPRNISKSVEIVNNLREQNRFSTIIKNGYDPITASLILRKVIPKHILPIFEKAEGGLERIVEDYSKFLQENPEQQVQTQTQQEVTDKKELINEFEPKNPAPENFKDQSVSPTESTIEAQEKQTPVEINNKIEPITREPSLPETETIGNLAILPKGEIGQIESIKNGVAKINVNGKIINQKASEIQQEPQGIENAVRYIINSIPEEFRSTNLQSIVHVPGINLLLSQFYDGKWAWYKDVPEETYKNISLGTYEPKTQGETSLGKYKPGVADSRGAGFSKEIVRNPKYSKENKGITWGYASNEYSLMHTIQDVIHKISKEKIDESGQIKISKKRKKSTD